MAAGSRSTRTVTLRERGTGLLSVAAAVAAVAAFFGGHWFAGACLLACMLVLAPVTDRCCERHWRFSFSPWLKVTLAVVLLFGARAALEPPAADEGALSRMAATTRPPVVMSKFDAPAIVCGYLADQGLAAAGWKDYGSTESTDYGCNSPYKEIGSGFPLANNVAFYVYGDETRVTKLSLVLNVNNAAAAEDAHKTLSEIAGALMRRAAHSGLSEQVQAAILAGQATNADSGKFHLAVTRQTWPTGRGYELHVDIT